MLETLANVSQLVGAIGVVVTLVYLAQQIRLTRKAWVRQNEREMTTQLVSSMSEFTSNPDLARIHFLGMEDFSGKLTREERLIWHAWLWSWISSFEQATLDRETGHFNAGELVDIYTEGYATVLRSPGGLEWWSENKWLFRKATQEHLDQAMLKSGRTTFDVVRETTKEPLQR